MSDTTPGAEPTPDPTPEPTPGPTPGPTEPVQPAASTPPPYTPPADAPAAPAASAASGPDYAAQASQAADKLKAGNPLDLGIIGAGLVAFIASLMPFYTISVDFLGASTSESVNAWHGFFGWFGVLAAVAGAGLLVARVLGIALPLPVRTVVLGLFGLATLCLLLALFVTPGGSCDDSLLGGDLCDAVDQGHGIGYWLALLAAVAGTALSFMRRSDA